MGKPFAACSRADWTTRAAALKWRSNRRAIRMRIRIDGTMLGAVNRLLGLMGLLVGLAILFVGGFWIHYQHLDAFLGLIAKSDSAMGQVVENRPVRVYPGS